MCTVSWCRPDRGSYTLFFNRDESKKRLPALAPQIFRSGDTAFLSPVDGDHGGTWLLVNERGLSIGLLNHYSASVHFSPDSPISRGALVTSLANTKDCAHFDQRMAGLQGADYRPFLIFAVSPSESSLWIWDGEQLAREDFRLPLTTSSFQSESVISERRQLYATISQPDSAKLESYHQSHDPMRPEYSVRMRRERSQTVSHSRIDVSDDQVNFSYRPEPDESLILQEPQTLSIPRHGL